MIKEIDAESVRLICSGQVICDLSTAVKELVENALDAGATNLEIKLNEYGYVSIEVSDNGDGIHPSNYESIALKHCTNKLQSFHDLNSLNSYGFRGEALNALCEISGELIITTKQTDQEVGYQLKFNHIGQLISKTPINRSAGTTVTIHRLFDTLPVRRMEFQRNIKKQYTKLLKVIQSYAVILTHIKLNVFNTLENQKSKNAVLSTTGVKSLDYNISALFGAKFLQSLQYIHIQCESTTTTTSDTIGNSADNASNASNNSNDGNLLDASGTSQDTSKESQNTIYSVNFGNTDICAQDIKKRSVIDFIYRSDNDMTSLITIEDNTNNTDNTSKKSNNKNNHSNSHSSNLLLSSKDDTNVTKEIQKQQDQSSPYIAKITGYISKIINGGNSNPKYTSSTTPFISSSSSNSYSGKASSNSRSSSGVSSSGSSSHMKGVDQDRQYMYINHRPVDMPKISRLIHEIWRKYDMKNKPAYIINFDLPPHTVDINLSPNKRDVALFYEHEITIQLNAYLDQLFASQCHGVFTQSLYEIENKTKCLLLPSLLSTSSASSSSSTVVLSSMPHITTTTTTIQSMKDIISSTDMIDIQKQDDHCMNDIEVDRNKIISNIVSNTHNTVDDKENKGIMNALYNNSQNKSTSPVFPKVHVDFLENDMRDNPHKSLSRVDINDSVSTTTTINNNNNNDNDNNTHSEIIWKLNDTTQKSSICTSNTTNRNINHECLHDQNINHVSVLNNDNTLNNANKNDKRTYISLIDDTLTTTTTATTTTTTTTYDKCMTDMTTTTTNDMTQEQDDFSVFMSDNDIHTNGLVSDSVEYTTSNIKSNMKFITTNLLTVPPKRRKIRYHKPLWSSYYSYQPSSSQLDTTIATTRNTDILETSPSSATTNITTATGTTTDTYLTTVTSNSSNNITHYLLNQIYMSNTCTLNQSVPLEDDVNTLKRKSIHHIYQYDGDGDGDGDDLSLDTFSPEFWTDDQYTRKHNILSNSSQNIEKSLVFDNTNVDDDTSYVQSSNSNVNKDDMQDTLTIKESIENNIDHIKTVHQQDFPKMRIIGQFNLGFIIVILNERDMYILDQHACDEKYRFEQLQQTVAIHHQPLLVPICIECSPIEEMVLMDNLSIFISNGFKITYNEDAPIGQRCYLNSVPYSKQTQFGITDVYELLNILMIQIDTYDISSLSYSTSAFSSGTGSNYESTKVSIRNTPINMTSASGSKTNASCVNNIDRNVENNNVSTSTKKKEKSSIILPKLMNMYASRACRSAVMIGTALKEKDMRDIINHLEGLYQPWNCPHGRPTMRYLVDLNSIS